MQWLHINDHSKLLITRLSQNIIERSLYVMYSVHQGIVCMPITNTLDMCNVSFALVLSNQLLFSCLWGAVFFFFFAAQLHITSNFHNAFRLAYSMRTRNHYLLNCEWNVYAFSLLSFITWSMGKRNGEWNEKKKIMMLFIFFPLLIFVARGA